MSDFVSKEEISIDVLGRPFKFKELSGVEHDSMTDKATSINADGLISYKVSEQNKGYLGAVVEAPYPEWSGLTVDDRVPFLNSLKKPIRDELIKQIREHHSDLGDDLKN